MTKLIGHVAVIIYWIRIFTVILNGRRTIPQLPADIMANIIYRANIPTSQRSRVSKGVEARSRQYLKEECNKPVSHLEFLSYLKKDPKVINVFYYMTAISFTYTKHRDNLWNVNIFLSESGVQVYHLARVKVCHLARIVI